MIAEMHFVRLGLLRTGCLASAPPSCHRTASVCTPPRVPPAAKASPPPAPVEQPPAGPLYPNVPAGQAPGPFGDRSAFSHRDNCAQF